MWWLLNRTRIGLMIRAGVDDRDMPAASGVRIQLVIVFAFGAGLAGPAGVVGGTFQSLAPGGGHPSPLRLPRGGHAHHSRGEGAHGPLDRRAPEPHGRMRALFLPEGGAGPFHAKARLGSWGLERSKNRRWIPAFAGMTALFGERRHSRESGNPSQSLLCAADAEVCPALSGPGRRSVDA